MLISPLDGAEVELLTAYISVSDVLAICLFAPQVLIRLDFAHVTDFWMLPCSPLKERE